jgi:signal transduction histidine kinase
MRERVEHRGGTLSLETAPGRGFSVTAVLPMPEWQ